MAASLIESGTTDWPELCGRFGRSWKTCALANRTIWPRKPKLALLVEDALDRHGVDDFGQFSQTTQWIGETPREPF